LRRCAGPGLLRWKSHALDIRNQLLGDLSAQLTAHLDLHLELSRFAVSGAGGARRPTGLSEGSGKHSCVVRRAEMMNSGDRELVGAAGFEPATTRTKRKMGIH
jgi:hypothetical protein